MSHATDSIERFWHDHPGARWLAPMAVGVALVIGILIAMLIYPHIR